MSFRFAMVVVSVALGGCASRGADHTIDITYDPCAVVIDPGNASSDRVAAISDAMDMWNSDAATRLSYSGDDTVPQLQIVFQDAAGAFHGLYDDERGIIFVNTRLEGHELAITIAHELGHAFGLHHVKRKSVMLANNLTVSPNPSDALRLQAMWGTCESASANENEN